jgi:hypothetical protein
MAPSALAKGGGLSSGPTSRAIDALSAAKVGAGCLAVSVGLVQFVWAVWVRWLKCLARCAAATGPICRLVLPQCFQRISGMRKPRTSRGARY